MLRHIWKIVTGLAVVVALAGSLFAISDRIAWAEDVQQSLSVMRMGVKLQFDTCQLEDMMMQRKNAKRDLVDHPNDQDLISDIKFYDDQIRFLQSRIQNTTRKLSRGEVQ